MSVAIQSLRLPVALVDRLAAHGLSSANEAVRRGQGVVFEHCRCVGVPPDEFDAVWREISSALTLNNNNNHSNLNNNNNIVNSSTHSSSTGQERRRRSALSMLEEQQNLTAIPSFSQNLDNLLDGGIFLNSGIVEFVGMPGAGKTQVCMQLCASVQIPEALGSVGGSALYIDTEGSFMGERFHDIATATRDHLLKIIANNNSQKNDAAAKRNCGDFHFPSAKFQAQSDGSKRQRLLSSHGSASSSGSSHQNIIINQNHNQNVNPNQHNIKFNNDVTITTNEKVIEENNAPQIPSVDEMMENVYIFRLFDVHEQLSVIMKLDKLLENAKNKVCVC